MRAISKTMLVVGITALVAGITTAWPAPRTSKTMTEVNLANGTLPSSARPPWCPAGTAYGS